MSNELTLAPKTIDEAVRFSDLMAKSDMVPKDYHNRPANVLVAIAWGMDLGLAPMQAMQNIAVINGKPSIYGDAALAVVLAHPACEDVQERIDGDGEAMRATCLVKRKGRSDTIATFSVADAKRANLWGKSGPWTQYPRRMLQMRARGFALRDAFPDALRGLITQEEARDYPEPPRATIRDMGPAERVDAPPPARPDPEPTELTVKAVREAAGRAIARTSREDVLETLSSLGYSRAEEIPDAERATVIAELDRMEAA